MPKVEAALVLSGDKGRSRVNLPADRDVLQRAINQVTDDDSAEVEDTSIDPDGLEEELRSGDAADLHAFNELLQRLQGLPLSDAELAAVVDGCLDQYEPLSDVLPDLEARRYYVWTECCGIEGLARAVLEDKGLWEKVPEDLRAYVDLEQYAEDLLNNGRFFEGDAFFIQILS